jgi:hypothetical protein
MEPQLWQKILLFSGKKWQNTTLNLRYCEGYTNGLTSVKGYRLMVVSTSNEPAMKIRPPTFIKCFPDQNNMSFSNTLILKLSLVIFLERADAERARKLIISTKLVFYKYLPLPGNNRVKPSDKEEEKE